MSTNRVLYVLIAIAVVAAAAFSLRQVVVTKAAGSASSMQADRSYDQIEKLRLGDQTDRSFDEIESIRQNRSAPASSLEGDKCFENECTYRLPNGQPVK